MAEGTELAKYYVQIVPSAKGISGGIKKALGGEEAGESFGASLISGLKKVVAAAAIGKFFKDSIAAGANVEQSFGGIETIYGSASDTMKQFAVDAAKSGISMNTVHKQRNYFAQVRKNL